MKIGFTGTRKGLTPKQKEALSEALRGMKISEAGASEFHHGDCLGADDDADEIVRDLHIPIIIHPPSDSEHRAFNRFGTVLPTKSYLERNKDIAQACDLLVACPEGQREKQRSGTWMTVRCARNLGKEVLIIFPDGNSYLEKRKMVTTFWKPTR